MCGDTEMSTSGTTEASSLANGRSGIDAQIDRRRKTVAARWNLNDELILIAAGDPIPVPGRGDRTYPYQPHSEFFYLTDRIRPGGVVAFDPEEGWTDFV